MRTIFVSLMFLACGGMEALEYHVVKPCRIVDTRIPSPTQPCDEFGCWGIAVNAKEIFWAAGDATRVGYKNRPFEPIPHSFANQGGEPNGCGVPMDAKAVHINFTAVPVPHPGNGDGHFRIWPYEIVDPRIWGLSKPPLASALNWHNFAVVGNAVTIPICDPDIQDDCEFDFVITAAGTPAHLIADVYGYFK